MKYKGIELKEFEVTSQRDLPLITQPPSRAKENKMQDTVEAKVDMDAVAKMPRPMYECIRSNADIVVELAFERREISNNLSKLERDIKSDPAAVSDYHKELWHKQAAAMRAYKEVIGERIKDLIDG